MYGINKLYEGFRNVSVLLQKADDCLQNMIVADEYFRDKYFKDWHFRVRQPLAVSLKKSKRVTTLS